MSSWRASVPDAVAAVDPSESFVAAARERNPGVDVRRAAAEDLPFADGEFDAALAQLVVHFMADPVAGLKEMARVGGVVAACVWDHQGGQGPLGVFWEAVRSLDPDARDESDLAGAREGHLAELFAQAGLGEIEQTRDRGAGRARELRGVVGAVHARRRPGGRVRGAPRARRARPAARPLPGAAPARAVHGDGAGLGRAGSRRLAQREIEIRVTRPTRE